jgi:putative transport protein
MLDSRPIEVHGLNEEAVTRSRAEHGRNVHGTDHRSEWPATLRGGVTESMFVLLLGGVLMAGPKALFGWSAALTAGVFTGAFTNTPVLAGMLETLKTRGLSNTALAAPVVGYSATCPVGVIGVLLAIYLLKRVWHIGPDAPSEALVHRSVRVTHPETSAADDSVRLGRVQHARHLGVAIPGIHFVSGDVVSVIGDGEDVRAAALHLGVPAREDLDMRRIFVSRGSVAGRNVGDLHLQGRFGVVLTCIRRGDVDLLAHDRAVLELGDRVRVIVPPRQLELVAKLLGNSANRLSEIDMLTFGLGLPWACCWAWCRSRCPAALPSGWASRAGRLWSGWSSVPWAAVGRWCGSSHTAPT